MRLHLKFAAFAQGQFFPAGLAEDWPDDVEPPSTAKKLSKDETPDEPELDLEPEPTTLSEMQKKGLPKK